MTLNDSTRAALDNARRQLSQAVARKSAGKTDTTIRYTTATGDNEIHGITCPALLPVRAGDWTAYIQEGADRLILGPIGGGTVTEYGAYTPTWTVSTLGTGGSSEGQYVYVGGPNPGDHGILHVMAYISFGSGGTPGNGCRFTIPPGFTITPVSSYLSTGNAMCVDASASNNRYQAHTRLWTSTELSITVMNTASTFASVTDINNTTPFGWANGDWIRAYATMEVVRT